MSKDWSVVLVDADFVRRAVEQADLNALRVALLHATGDSSLAAMKLNTVLVRGGATSMKVVAPEHHDELKTKAVSFLLNGAENVPEVPPSDAELRSLMVTLTGEELTDKDFAY